MIKNNNQVKSYFLEDSIGCWESNKFNVFAFAEGPLIRLDVERKDKKDGISWDELQQIKSDCGYGDKDAIELFPKDKDVLNTANWRHLYIFQEEIPFVRRVNKD